VEAGLSLGWSKYIGTGASVSIEHFGASADYKTLFEKFGMTTGAVVKAARSVLGGSH
jgi:transketolase